VANWSVFVEKQARAVKDTVEAWKADHDEAMEVRGIEALVDVSIVMGDFIEGLQEEAWEKLFAGEQSTPLKTGELFRLGYSLVLDAFEATAGCVETMRARGYEVEKSEQFSEAWAAVRQQAADFAARWPTIDPAAVEEARERRARGEFLSAEDFRRELLRDH
jgi:hypothetical protein